MVLVIVFVLLWLFVFSNNTPGDQFKNIESSDITSITGSTVMPKSNGELKGKDIDKFIQLLRDADYKKSDQTEHYASSIEFTIKYNDGKEQRVTVIGSYMSDDTLFNGFIRVDDGDLYECDTEEME